MNENELLAVRIQSATKIIELCLSSRDVIAEGTPLHQAFIKATMLLKDQYTASAYFPSKKDVRNDG
jgi:hypothetical protein